MTTLIEQANALHARLATLGKVPDDLTLIGGEWEHNCDYTRAWYPLRNSGIALAILRDAARRVCDEHFVRIGCFSSKESVDMPGGYFAMDRYKNYLPRGGAGAITRMTEEQALIFGLDYIIEQRGEDA